MQICEVTEPLIETKIVWAKKGKNNITRKYRCSFGKRKGRVVASPSQCSAPAHKAAMQRLRRHRPWGGQSSSSRRRETPLPPSARTNVSR